MILGLKGIILLVGLLLATTGVAISEGVYIQRLSSELIAARSGTCAPTQNDSGVIYNPNQKGF
jgi:hypothetical protein